MNIDICSLIDFKRSKSKAYWKLNTVLHANANCNSRHKYGSNYGQGPQDKEESWDRWLLLDFSQVYNVEWPAAEHASLTVLGLDIAGPLGRISWVPEDHRCMITTPSPANNDVPQESA